MAIWGPPNIERLLEKKKTEVLIAGLEKYSQDKYADWRCRAIEVMADLKEFGTVPVFIKALRDHDCSVRVAAATALGKLGNKAALEPLAQLLGDPRTPERERCAVAEALGNLGDPAAIVPLLHAHGPLLSVQKCAAEALAKLMGPDAIGPLATVLSEVKPTGCTSGVITRLLGFKEDDAYQADCRIHAARALGELKDPRGVPSLTSALCERNDYLRLAAVKALGEIGDISSVKSLAELLGLPRQEVRDASKDVVRKPFAAPVFFQPSLREPHLASKPELRIAAIETIARIGGSTVIEGLLSAFEGANQRERVAIVRALGTIGDRRSVPLLISALADSDPEIRTSSAEALGATKDAVAIMPLMLLLADARGDVRKAASQALTSLGEPNWGNAYAIDHGQNMLAIAWIKDPRVVDVFVRVLEAQGDTVVVQIAAKALGALKDKRAVAPLVRVLRCGNRGTRIAFISALGELRCLEAIEPLGAELRTHDPDTFAAAAEALRSISEPRAIELLLEALVGSDRVVRVLATGRLATAKAPQAVGPLVALLKDSCDEDAVVIASALGSLADPRAIEALMIALENEQKSTSQEVYLWALGECIGPVLHDPGARTVVFEKSPGIRVLVGALTSPRIQARKRAAEVLVWLYRSNNLDSAAKSLLLASRESIIRKHQDMVETWERFNPCGLQGLGGTSHTDSGIGVDFPL